MRPNSPVFPLVLASIAGAAPGSPALAQGGLIPRDVLFGNPQRAGVQVSPDGRHLSFRAPVDGVMNVWVAPVGDPGAARPVTADRTRGIVQYFWAFTGDHILYTQDVGGDENFKVFAVDLPAGQTRDLTPFDQIPGPDGQPLTLPGGKVMRPRASIQQVSRRFPDEILVAINNRSAQYHDIHRVNIRTGELTPVQLNDEFAGFDTDDGFNVRFASRFVDDGGVEVLAPDGRGGWELFWKIAQEDVVNSNAVGFDESGEVFFIFDSTGADTSGLVAVNTRTKERRVLFRDAKADAAGAIIHPATNAIQAVSSTYLREKWAVLDPAIAPDLEALARVAPGDFAITSRTLDDRLWTVAYVVDDGPVRYYLYDRPSRTARFLFTNRPALEGLALAKMHPVEIKARDGLTLVSYLTLPHAGDTDGNARPDRPLPMVLFVHGGPWARDSWGYNPYHQWLADRGYAVLSVNYRGSTGFGKAFTNAANLEWGGKMHDDLLDAVGWAVAEKIADPDKVAIMGGSYGGYATLVGLTFTPDTFACGVDIVGPSNIVTLLNTIPPYWAPAVKIWRDRVGDHTTEEGRTFLESRSPLTFVERIKRPLLIGQGANDPRVKQSESDQIVAAMQARKIPVTYALFPDEGHGFARPENNKAFNAVTEAFLAQHLGGQYQPVEGDFEGSSISVPQGADLVPGVGAALPK